jgi:DNA-binding response OmpR family regulator
MARIIIQDADQDILDIICIALELEGFTLLTVLGFDTDFISLIERFKPHVVMLDYGLAEEECVKICRSIKTSFPNLPVIVLSCNSQIAEIYQKVGFDDYITKPFDLKQLFYTLRKHIPKYSPQLIA